MMTKPYIKKINERIVSEVVSESNIEKLREKVETNVN